MNEMSFGRKLLWGFVAVAFLAAGTGVYVAQDPSVLEEWFLKPGSAYAAETLPPAPDYSQDTSWVALPGRQDASDVVPPESGAQDSQSEALVDVFFIHPTTYFGTEGWNARYDEGGDTLERLEDGVMRFQASAYNGSARIYAPRYRQATLYSFWQEQPDGDKALMLAYSDVERAFDEFLKRREANRPFILASHSQGSFHGLKLLIDRISGTPLERQLVAAYLIGYSVPTDIGANIGPCKTAHSTGCYLNWNSVTASSDTTNWLETSKIWIGENVEEIAGRPLTCINPLTGEQDGAATKEQNLGGLAFVETGAPMGTPRKALTGAKCVGGMLIVTPPSDDPGLTFGVNDGDYHIYDYNLFYMNVRQDIARRVGAFWKS